jgi:hypothetical protein
MIPKEFFRSPAVADSIASLLLWALLGWVVWEYRGPDPNGGLYILILGGPPTAIAAFLGAKSLSSMRESWDTLNWPVRLLGIAAFSPAIVLLLWFLWEIGDAYVFYYRRYS